MTAIEKQTTAIPDWSLGRYEHTAVQLHPAAQALVDRARPGPGDRVLDIGCGTGNAALLAAARGASVIGVDPAARLLEVARARAAGHDFEATFELGDAAVLPVGDGEIDVALSAFGIIFAPDAGAAAAELHRVTAPTARVVLTAWLPGGALSDVAAVGRDAMARALGGRAAAPPFPWHDQAALQNLFGPFGFAVATHEQRIAFTSTSPREYLESDSASHPLAVAARAVLEPLGEADAVRDRMFEIYEAANEDPSAFRITSRYVVAVADRSGQPRRSGA